jgi:hypothetical protein
MPLGAEQRLPKIVEPGAFFSASKTRRFCPLVSNPSRQAC